MEYPHLFLIINLTQLHLRFFIVHWVVICSKISRGLEINKFILGEPILITNIADMGQKKRGAPNKSPELIKKKRAVSLTDREFEKSKEYYVSPSKAVLFAIKLKEELSITKE